MHGYKEPASLESAFQPYTRSSGSGSELAYARPYVTFLVNFLAYSGDEIRSIADVGCGDQVLMDDVMKGLDFLNVRRPTYLGVDGLSRRVELNRNLHPDLPCFCGDAREPSAFIGADLTIAKDVLQHWDTPSIVRWLKEWPPGKFMLITNCARGEGVNGDIAIGDWRPVDLTKPPFEIGRVVFSWDTKDVVLIG